MGCGTSTSQLSFVESHNQIPKSPLNQKEAKQVKSVIVNEVQQLEIDTDNLNKKEDRVNTSSTDQNKHEPMKHVPEGRAYLFGQSANERKIVMLNCEKMQFSILSSRTQVPPTPHKYLPQEIIFEQSQELQASHLFNTNSHPPYNFMFITFINDNTIFLCGGVTYQFEYISEEAFLFHVDSSEDEAVVNGNIKQSKQQKKGQNLVGTKFQKLSYMKQKRYSHMGAYFKIGKLGYIFAFGGRGEDDVLLNSCEQYSIEEKKWREITPMRMPRSTGFSLIFKNKIYLFGGYSAEKKRSKLIEVYDPFKNYWETLNVKLHRGIEAGLTFSVKPNEILLIGGNMESGALKSSIKINLAEQTYVWDSNMKNQRMLQKAIKYNEVIYVFGGDFNDNFERYSLKDRKWKDHALSYSQYISTDDINSFQIASETLEVLYDESLLTKADANVGDYQKFYLFGNQSFPCILEINLNKFVLKKKSVPMSIRLRSFMGVAKIMDGKYFLAGGIDPAEDKISKAAYIYYSNTNKGIEVQKMNKKKYQFGICCTPKNVYIFGGKSVDNQILSQCEKYNFQEQKWMKIGSLNSQKYGCKCMILQDNILIFGGADSLQLTSTDIEIFMIKEERFMEYKLSFNIPSEVTYLYLHPEKQNSLIIFSHNDVLNKTHCHQLTLEDQFKSSELQGQDVQGQNQLHPQGQNQLYPQEQQPQEKLGKQQLSVSYSEIQLQKLASPILHSFTHSNKFHFFTNKCLVYNELLERQNQKQNMFVNQIVINQVEMLQYPMERFSSCNQ